MEPSTTPEAGGAPVRAFSGDLGRMLDRLRPNGNG